MSIHYYNLPKISPTCNGAEFRKVTRITCDYVRECKGINAGMESCNRAEAQFITIYVHCQFSDDNGSFPFALCDISRSSWTSLNRACHIARDSFPLAEFKDLNPPL